MNAKTFLINHDSILKDLVQPISKFKEDTVVSEVLSNFQKSSVNFGAVTAIGDELLGIVTIHDLGEALIGKYA